MTNPTPHGQVPEALRLANVCSNLTRYSMDAHLIAAELRRQHNRIAELESQLAQRFDAAPAQPAAEASRFGSPELQAMIIARCVEKNQADSVPAVEREQERIAFKDAHRHLELDEVPDAWGRPMFKHSHIEASWLGWIARASHGQVPAAPKGDIDD